MTTPTSKTPTRNNWSEVERCVDAFRAVMLEKLKKNQHKGNREGWKGDSAIRLLARVEQEWFELKAEVLLLAGEPLPGNDAPIRARIVREAADVANMAMMVADAAGALDVPAESVSHADLVAALAKLTNIPPRDCPWCCFIPAAGGHEADCPVDEARALLERVRAG